MPIIDKHDLVFIHVPKCAGTSIERSLGYKGNWKKKGGDRKTWFGSSNGYELDHSTIKYLIENCNSYKDTYMKLAVVRNPYERLVSEYNFCKRYGSRFIKNSNTFKEFVYELKDRFDFVLENEEKQHFLICHYLPQYKFTHIDNECKIDTLLRFETLQEDWNNFCSKINKEIVLLKLHQYSSGKKYNYLDYYDEELKQIVYELYKDDFKLFNYER